MTRLSANLISIIDDDESMRSALATLVRVLGFEADAYGSAEQFLAVGVSVPSCCIISDIHMPGLSGVVLKRRLDAVGSTTPVILITGRSEPHLLDEARASGAIGLLRKPFDADSLLDCLRKARVARTG
jgi:FixJ family two-component response regulator